MIDFANSIQKTGTFPEGINAEDTLLGDTTVDAHGVETASISDTARRLIASNPATYFTIALAVGGILGWLTSKR